jgi:ATP-dependent Clp protease ATP-binding subunit ClpC
MQLTVAIYQSSAENELTWTTLGLGGITQSHTARSIPKVRRRLLDKLKSALGRLESAQMLPLRPALDAELTRLRLELRLESSGNRRKLSGFFPVIIEPRWLSAAQRVNIGYHPLRQSEWFVVNETFGLQRSAELFFQKAWVSLPNHQIASLESNKQDRIKLLSFDFAPPSLLDQLEDEEDVWQDMRPRDPSATKKRLSKPPLKVVREIGVDQTQRAADGALDGGLVRGEFSQRASLLLGGKRKQPTLVCGPSGCGKTTLLAAWVNSLLDEQGYRVHRNLDKVTHVYRISGQRLIAGMSHLGEWEQRCMELLAEVRAHDVALWVDDLHAFGQLGRSRDSDRNLAEVFRGPLSRGELLMVGECTPEQLQRLEDDAPSFAALFVPLMLPATSRSDTLRIMLHRARKLEADYLVAFEPDIYQHLVTLAESLLPGALPAKALDPLEELARRHQADDSGSADKPAASKSKNKSKRKSSIGLDDDTIGARELIAWLSTHTGLPQDLLAPREPLLRDQIRRHFSRQVMGQSTAVDAAVDLVLRVRSGMTAAFRPLAVYLFTGPTGTGKTALAQALASYLYSDAQRLIRLDMGEHNGPDAVARLVGDRLSPHGQLVQRVREQPFSCCCSTRSKRPTLPS